MRRFDLRVVLLAPLLLLTTSACGDDPAAPPVATPSAPAATSAAPAPEPSPSATAADPVESSEYVEEDEEPKAEPGELPGEAQALLDQALGDELTALATAPPAEASKRQATLEKLPENPSEVLTALMSYQWFSPDARKAYEKAVALSGRN